MNKIIDWRITSLCNNHCKYCYGSKKINILSKSEERKVIEEINKSSCEIINITGGEPMLDSKRCLRLIDSFKKGNKDVYLSTNGCNCIENIDYLIDNVTMLGLPLDGYNSETNAVNGRSVEQFNQVIELLDLILIKNRSYNVKIGTVVTHLNATKQILENIAKIIQKYPFIKTWRVYEYIPINRGKKNESLLKLNSLDISTVKSTIDVLKSELPNVGVEFITRDIRDAAYFIIQPDGSVIVPMEKGNRSLEVTIGNLCAQDIECIYQKWFSLSRNKEYIKKRINDVKKGV